MYFNQFFLKQFSYLLLYLITVLQMVYFHQKIMNLFLKVNEAFKVNVKNISKKSFFLNFEVAEDYYLYKKNKNIC